MKRILTLITILFAQSQIFAQMPIYCGYTPPEEETNSSFFQSHKGQTQCLPYGYAHTPKGNLNMMMIFVTFTEDQTNTNPENTVANWPKDGIPSYASNVLNLMPNSGPIASKSNNLSGYYETMSGYNGTTGFSLTGKIFHVTISKQFTFNPLVKKEVNLLKFEITLCQRTIIALQSQYPLEDWSAFDKRDNINGPGTRSAWASDNSSLFSDNIIDYTSFNFRLLPSDLAPFNTGADPVKRMGITKKINFSSDYNLPNLQSNGNSFQIDCGNTLLIPANDENWFYSYFIHEFGHAIFGLNHNMGANDVTGYHFNSFYGWGMMADVSKFFNTSNAWENWTYGWSNPQVATPSVQTYVIKDFVTTKDAIKVPIPNTNQSLWIENHQLINQFDHKNTTNLGSVSTGLYMYVSSYENAEGNCVTIPNTALYPDDIPYSRTMFWSNYLKVLSKEGNRDFSYPYSNNAYNFVPQSDNPISGINTAQSVRIDMNQDNIIDYRSEDANVGSNEHTRVYKLNGIDIANWSGNSSSAFTVGDELSLSGILPVLNYPYVESLSDRQSIYDKKTPSTPIKLTPYILNGIKINILSFNSLTGEYTISVSFNDVSLRNDKNWTGRIELPNLIQGSASDLVLKAGKTLVIKRSGTANTQLNSVQENIINYAWPTKFTLQQNALFETETGSNVIVKDQSSIELNAGSTIEIASGSVFTVQEGSSFILNPNANLIIKDGGRLVIENQSFFKYYNNGQIVLEGPNSILEFKGGSRLQIGENATFNYAGEGYIKITTNNELFPLFEAIGNNARVRIITKGFNLNNKKIIEINGGSYVCDVNFQNTTTLPNFELKEISIQNGMMQFDKNTGLAISGKETKCDFRNLFIKAKIENTISERHLGLILNGQRDNLIYRVTIRDAVNGLTCNNFYAGNSISVLQYTAFSCDIGLQINGVGARIQEHKIYDCKTAIYLQGMYGGTRLYRGEIFNSNIGILALNCGSTIIELFQPKIYNNYYGLYATNSTFTGACGKIYNNAAANSTNGKYLGANVFLGTNGNLILDPTFRPGIGRMDLSNIRSVSVRLSNSSVGPLISNSQSSLLTDNDYSICGIINRDYRTRPSAFSLSIPANNNLWRTSAGTSISPVNLVDYNVTLNDKSLINKSAYYLDPNPISNYVDCGSGISDRFKGYLPSQITTLNDLSDFVLSNGSSAKSTIYDAYQFAFDNEPNTDLAINNFMDVLNHQFTPEEYQDWNEALIILNAQLIEVLKEGIEEDRIVYNPNEAIPMVVNQVIALQDKLLNDYKNDSQNYAGFQLSKAEVLRLVKNYPEALQTVYEIDLDFSPTYEQLKSSYNCMLLNEYDSWLNTSNLLNNNYGISCYTEIDFSNMDPFTDNTLNEESKIDKNSNKNLSNNQLKVYPIPAKNLISISISSGHNIPGEYELYDNLGKSIRKQFMNLDQDSNLELNISDLQTGIYTLKMRYQGKEENHKIIVIEN